MPNPLPDVTVTDLRTWVRRQLTGALDARFDDLDTDIRTINRKIRRLERVMARFEDQISNLDSVTSELADRWELMELTNVELRAAVAAGDQTRAAALAAQSEQHADVVAAGVERLRAIGADAEDPVPDTEPLPEPTPTPEPTPDEPTA